MLFTYHHISGVQYYSFCLDEVSISNLCADTQTLSSLFYFSQIINAKKKKNSY